MQHLARLLLFVCCYGSFSNTEGVYRATSTFVDCMRPILEQSFVDYAAVYFADNPRGTDDPIAPAALDPQTAQNLFTTYYGKDASAASFKESIMRILYTDHLGDENVRSPTTQASTEESDRIALRRNIYTYARAGSYNIAREKFGLLLQKSMSEIDRSLVEYDCFAKTAQIQMKDVIHSELSKVRNEIGEFQFGQFLGLGSGTTLAFAIDDTGSMGGEIEAAKRRAINIIDERQGSLDQPQNFVLVPFNDPGVGPLTVTHDPNTFKNAINQLYAHGGGDAPELSMRGIQLAVENSNAGSTIFVITDIDAKDVDLQDNIVAQAKQKNIKITFLLTNRVGTTMCIDSVRGRSDKRCRNRALKLGYALYEYIAESTGGSILVVSKTDIFKATEVIESTLKQGLEELYIKRFKVGEKVDHFSVDSSLSRLFLQSQGACDNITVIRPNGTEAPLEGDVDVDKLTVRSVAVNDTFGRYSLKVQSLGDCEIKVSARSTKGFVKTLAKKITDATSGKTRIERFDGQALETDDIFVLIDEFGKQPGDTTQRVEIVDKNSNISYEFPITKQHGNHHNISFKEYPEKSLFVVVKGADKLGYQYQRISPSPIEFVTADIDCSSISDMVFRAGDNATVNVTVRNLGNTEVFSMEASDDKGYVERQDVFRLRLKRSSSGVFPLTFIAKKGDRTGTVSTVTITASPKDGKNLIFKQCRLIVGQKETPNIESFHVVSNINSRFVETTVTSTVFNNASVGRMAEFNVIMPLDSFITEFSMTIDDVTYPGEIKEKELARKIFEGARARGVTAAHVASREKSTTVFTTSVNLEANKRVVFNLNYQQLLRRSRRKYRHEVIVQTEQPVGAMSIDVYICETRPLDTVDVLGFDTEQSVLPGPISMPGVAVDQQSTTAHISFKPTREEQLKISPLGLNGKFVVEYDVVRERGKDLNEVVADERHFVHFFSSEMEPISKRVVFVLDNSASMHGRKMEQVRNAMAVVLEGLNKEDHFAIVMFNSNVTQWVSDMNAAMAPATTSSRDSANKFLKDVKSRGSTNIGLAITSAIEILRNFSAASEKNLHPTSDFILLLTDGRPTEGAVDSSELVDLVDRSNNRTYGIHAIGFGSLVDMKTLAKIASRNNGSSIQIFEDIDADLQISDFFETFARPMLHDIEITYDPVQVESTSVPIFPVLFDGSEVVVAGKFSDDGIIIKPQRRRRETLTVQFLDFTIKGKGKDKEEFELTDKVEPALPSTECLEETMQVESFTERLSVFMELQHMLKRISAENNNTIKEDLKKEALNQSLEYGFVTPGITSMVVLKPEDKKAIEEAIKRENEDEKVREKHEIGEGGDDDEEEVDHVTTATAFPPTRLPLLGEDGDDAFGTEARRLISSGLPAEPTLPRALVRPPLPTRRISPARDRALEFFGDPHFVVPLGEQITLCFNWFGHEGQVFNLIHDETSGITVNGKLTLLKSPKAAFKKTFVNEIGILLSPSNVTIHVMCYDMMVKDGAGNETSVSFASTKMMTLSGLRIVVYAKSMYTGEVLFEIRPGVVFRVIKRISLNEDRVLNHLDFTILEKAGISENAFGVLGQFSHDDAKKKEDIQIEMYPGKNKAVLIYKKRAVAAHMKTLYDYNRAKSVECWFVPESGDLLDKGRFRYLLHGIFDKPDLKKPAPRRRIYA